MAHDEVSWSAKDSVISQDRTEALRGQSPPSQVITVKIITKKFPTKRYGYYYH